MGTSTVDDHRPTAIDAVVVAGGVGRRLGQDKALVSRGHQTQVAHVVATLRPLGGTIVVAHGPRVLDLPQTIGVPDPPGLVGPVAGIVAGLDAATSDVVAIVAVDLVAPDVDLLRALADHVRGDAARHGLMPVQDGRLQPLHAVVRQEVGYVLARSGEDRLLAAYAFAEIDEVAEDDWRPWAPTADPARDIDTPADLPDVRRDPVPER